MTYKDATPRHSPPCCHVLRLRQAPNKVERYSPYSIKSATSAEDCSDQCFADLSLSEQPVAIPHPIYGLQHSLTQQCGQHPSLPHEPYSVAAQPQQVLAPQLQQTVTVFQGQYHPAQSQCDQGEPQQEQQRISDVYTLEQKDECYAVLEPKQDVLVNVAINLCARALNKAVKAFQTAHHVCQIAPDSAVADRTLELAETLMDTTIRRLRLAQNLAAVHHTECTDGTAAAAVAAAATWRAGAAASLDTSAAGTSAASGGAVSAAEPVMSGPSVHQQELDMSLQEEVCSSWDC